MRVKLSDILATTVLANVLSFVGAVLWLLSGVDERGVPVDLGRIKGSVSGANRIATTTAKNSTPELSKNGSQRFSVIVSPLMGVATISAVRTTAEK
jgi:hypothetical protein